MTRKKRRLYAVIAGMAALGVSVALVLNAFEDNLVFFFGPSEMAQKDFGPGQRLRLGGLVEENSIQRQPDGLTVTFRVTDMASAMPVTFTGVLPDLFREGQGVIVEGEIGTDGVFVAKGVLAKHDENYMPPEVAETLKNAGHWREDPQP